MNEQDKTTNQDEVSYQLYPIGNRLLAMATSLLTLPYLTFGVGRLLHLPSAEAVSVFGPMCNPDVTIRSQ